MISHSTLVANTEYPNIKTVIINAVTVPPSSQMEEDFDPPPNERPENGPDNSQPCQPKSLPQYLPQPIPLPINDQPSPHSEVDQPGKPEAFLDPALHLPIAIRKRTRSVPNMLYAILFLLTSYPHNKKAFSLSLTKLKFQNMCMSLKRQKLVSYREGGLNVSEGIGS